MNSLTAAELKRRGMAAIEEGLRKGPVHLLKHNKASAVVITASEYERLSGINRQAHGMTALEWLAKFPIRGRKSKAQIDKELRAERDAWG